MQESVAVEYVDGVRVGVVEAESGQGSQAVEVGSPEDGAQISRVQNGL